MKNDIRSSEKSSRTHRFKGDAPQIAEGGPMPSSRFPRYRQPTDVMDSPEFRRIVRDVVAACDSEDALVQNVSATASVEIDLQQERRRLAIELMRKNDAARSDRSIKRLFASEWTPEHIARLGGAPAPSTVRRWWWIHGVAPDAPVRKFAPKPKSAAERMYWAMKRSIEVTQGMRRTDASGTPRRPGDRAPASSIRSGANKTAPSDGQAHGRLGATRAVSGLSADPAAPAGRMPAARMGYATDAQKGDAAS